MALRGASLAAAATGGLLRVMGRDGKHTAMQPTAVVVDGGLFEHYAAFRGRAAPALTCCRACPCARRGAVTREPAWVQAKRAHQIKAPIMCLTAMVLLCF